ncbi:DUF1671-domain-containing protein [Artomyces pyxidatus]|uniref:DUF1671-domain-containing protein n=1 Tax=Artomyces pyxidatus TaxID=48021 RepID=A0ACB8T7E9_9AGAM|nr:DUF1671-domain-containing protein [Artomyces pyxidatus]
MTRPIEIDDSSDIEFVSIKNKNKPSATSEERCQICLTNFDKWPVGRRQAHYEQHFDGEASRTTQSLTSPLAPSLIALDATKPRSRSLGNHAKTSLKHDSKGSNASWHSINRDAFWYSSLNTEPPVNYTPGLIPFLKKALTLAVERKGTRRAVLCYPKTVHIYHEMWDSGWGCGYRNYLMACTALMDQNFQDTYFSLLDAPTPPSVCNLQALIEEAWKHGFDEEGAQQLRHKLVDKSKWIGTAELHVAFTYRGIPSQLADFHLPGAQVAPLLDWIKDYFSSHEQQGHRSVEESWRGLAAVVVTDRMPLILQHQGHSRTIVGYEVTKTGSINLLSFDPSKRIPGSIREMALASFSDSKTKETGSSKHKSGTAQRIMASFRKPFQSSAKRRASPSPPPTKPGRASAKRLRESNDDDVIVIEDGENDENDENDETQASESNSSEHHRKGKGKERQENEGPVDLLKALKRFRIEEKNLAKKEKYQVLWFPMQPPLTDAEKRRKQIVTSEKVS